MLLTAAWRPTFVLWSCLGPLTAARAADLESWSAFVGWRPFSPEEGTVEEAKDLLTWPRVQTELEPAVERGDLSLVRDLLQRGANPRALTSGLGVAGDPLFAVAVDRGHLAVAEELLLRRASLEERTFLGATPLIRAALQGKSHSEMVQALLLLRADASALDRAMGRTALHYAVTNGGMASLSAIEALSKAWPDGLNLQDQDGETPLTIVAQGGHLNLVNKLIGLGAKVTAKVKDFLDKKAIDTEIMDVLQRANSDLDAGPDAVTWLLGDVEKQLDALDRAHDAIAALSDERFSTEPYRENLAKLKSASFSPELVAEASHLQNIVAVAKQLIMPVTACPPPVLPQGSGLKMQKCDRCSAGFDLDCPCEVTCQDGIPVDPSGPEAGPKKCLLAPGGERAWEPLPRCLTACNLAEVDHIQLHLELPDICLCRVGEDCNDCDIQCVPEYTMSAGAVTCAVSKAPSLPSSRCFLRTARVECTASLGEGDGRCCWTGDACKTQAEAPDADDCTPDLAPRFSIPVCQPTAAEEAFMGWNSQLLTFAAGPTDLDNIDANSQPAELAFWHGASLKAEDDAGKNAFNLAIDSGQLAMFKWLIKRGASLEEPSSKGLPPLIVAAQKFRANGEPAERKELVANTALEMARVLLKAGASVNVVDKAGGQNALFHTFLTNEDDDDRMLRFLIDHNADVNAKNGLQKTVLNSAVQFGATLENIRMLCEAGACASVDVVDTGAVGKSAWTASSGATRTLLEELCRR